VRGAWIKPEVLRSTPKSTHRPKGWESVLFGNTPSNAHKMFWDLFEGPLSFYLGGIVDFVSNHISPLCKKITTPNTVIFWTMVMGPQAPAFANNYVQFPVFFTLRILATFTFFFARIKHHRNRIAIPFFSIRHGGMVVFGL